MEEAFGIVVFGVVIVGAIVAVVLFALSSGTYDRIGAGGLFTEDPHRPSPADAPVSAAVRDEEVRQMLEARNRRRVRRGQEPIDVEAELAALTQQRTVDPGLEAEIRELVEARNLRRMRQGREPLDVESEVARQLRELG